MNDFTLYTPNTANGLFSKRCVGICSSEVLLNGSQSVTTLDQFHPTASSEEQIYIDNILEKGSPQDCSEFQHSMTSNWEESPIEMQYSIHHVPLMLHGSASLAGQLGPVSPSDAYDETTR